MNSNTFIIGLAIFTAVFVVLQKRRNVQLPQHKWSELWCIFWGLLGIGGLVSGLIQYHNAATQRATLEPTDPDVIVSAVGLMTHLSIALLVIGMIGLIVSTIFFFASRRQRKNYTA